MKLQSSHESRRKLVERAPDVRSRTRRAKGPGPAWHRALLGLIVVGALAAAPPADAGGLIPDDVLGAEVQLDANSDLWPLIVTSTPTVGEMLRVGLVTDDAGLRRQALAASVAAIDADPQLQAQVEATLNGFRDPQIQSVRNMGKEQFTLEIMQALGASAKAPIRGRAAAIGRRLQHH